METFLINKINYICDNKKNGKAVYSLGSQIMFEAKK